MRSTETKSDETHAGLPAQPFTTYRRPLERAADLALAYLEALPERRVGADLAHVPNIRAQLAIALPEEGADPEALVDELSSAAATGLTAMNGPRYFGFVIGGTLPASMAADWLASAWDQNAPMFQAAPAAAIAEEVAAAWLVDLFGFPSETAVGFTTGATTANLVGLAAARHEVLRRTGWDVEADGLQGAPKVTVIVGGEVHPSLAKALRIVGFGQKTAVRVAVDDEGRMRADSLREAVRALTGPAIVAAQVGNVNSGAIDPLEDIVRIVRDLPNAWLHVDGAFGLWAAASPTLQPLVAALGEVDSAATDAHKWLNTPYDTGLAFVRNESAVRAAMSMSAAYLPSTGHDREPFDYVPEMSRRARGFPVYAALRSLGRRGVAQMIDRGCALARLFADRLAADPQVRILNEVALNQVLVRFGESDELTQKVIAAVQTDGTLWAGGTNWHGEGAMRLSVSGWATSEADIERSAEAILRILHELGD